MRERKKARKEGGGGEEEGGRKGGKGKGYFCHLYFLLWVCCGLVKYVYLNSPLTWP